MTRGIPLPTRRAVAAASIGVALLIAFAGSGRMAALVAALDLLLVLLIAVDAFVLGRLPLTVERRLPPRLHLGVAQQVLLKVENRSRFAVRLRLRDEAPAELSPVGDEAPLLLAARDRTEHRYAITPTRRGRFRFGDVVLRLEGPLGLGALDVTLPQAGEAHVWPDLRGAAKLMLATTARDLATLGIRRLRRDGEGTEFARLREYAQGDSPRDIDWKATARRGAPVTRVHETERSQNVVLCVDAGRAMAAEVEIEGGARVSKLDLAVNAALFLAFVAIRNGDRVGLAVFADGVQHFIPPAAGRGQYRRIAGVLHRTEPALAFVDYPALFRELSTRVNRRALVVLFTELFDEEQTQAMVAPMRLLSRRHVPLVVALRDPSVEGLLERAPLVAEPELPYRQAVAAELLEERERLRARVVTSGVSLVDTTPEALTIDAVNRYLEIKRRGVL